MITLNLSNSDAKKLIDLLTYIDDFTKDSRHPNKKNKGRESRLLKKKIIKQTINYNYPKI